MGRYVLKRLLETIPLLIVVSFVIFMFIRLIPGDPARLLAGQDATLEEVEALRELNGLNDPLPVQYANYIKNVLSGDMGRSLKTGDLVSNMLFPRYKPTITLAFMSMGWALVMGLVIGIFSAVFRGKWPDYMGMLIAVTGISLPSFWTGLMLIQILSVKYRLLPTGGMEGLRSYIMPSITLGAGIMAMIARFSRSEMIETLRNDYIRTARAKGLNEVEVISRHALRNSMIQVMTIIGLQFGFLLGGSVIVETVFSIPGLGRLLIDSINFRDYTVIQAELMIFSTQFIMINLIVDVLYGVLNPKIRYN
ncbi:ABC transporter permease [Anaeropeptidivorans aminofermentans]|jgi:glutathione transport system permease protein|uniref:ABC transporter permease n=1 Tax=Anaeropeptidivorans aminofermentans TaxID=2934315 RepID=UPI002024CD5A|nr:ABC transporter permease subunit [Anaeropeptidivorans aminofermentans]MBE6011076.1 ABC transporter permease subunit [Lachnospiraceae bacterium]